MAGMRKAAKKTLGKKAMKSVRGGLGSVCNPKHPYPADIAQGDEHANEHANVPPCPGNPPH